MPKHAPADAEADEATALGPTGRCGALKQLGLVVLCAAWVLLGTFGHDQWKTQDATTLAESYQRAGYATRSRGLVAGCLSGRRA